MNFAFAGSAPSLFPSSDIVWGGGGVEIPCPSPPVTFFILPHSSSRPLSLHCLPFYRPSQRLFLLSKPSVARRRITRMRMSSAGCRLQLIWLAIQPIPTHNSRLEATMQPLLKLAMAASLLSTTWWTRGRLSERRARASQPLTCRLSKSVLM